MKKIETTILGLGVLGFRVLGFGIINLGKFKATSTDLTLNGGVDREQYQNCLKLRNDFSKSP